MAALFRRGLVGTGPRQALVNVRWVISNNHCGTLRARANSRNELVVIVPVLMIVIPPIHRFVMGQAGLRAR